MQDKVTDIAAPLYAKGSKVYYVDSGFLVEGVIYSSRLIITSTYDSIRHQYVADKCLYQYKLIPVGTLEKDPTSYNESNLYDVTTTTKSHLLHVLNTEFAENKKQQIRCELEKLEAAKKQADERIAEAKKELKSLRPLLSA